MTQKKPSPYVLTQPVAQKIVDDFIEDMEIPGYKFGVPQVLVLKQDLVEYVRRGRLEFNKDNKGLYTLKLNFKHDYDVIGKTLTLREPKVEEKVLAQEDQQLDQKVLFKLASLLSNHDETLIDNITGIDCKLLDNVMNIYFLCF